ncbi:hypothetical protein [Ruminococcus sp. Marseille-P328]|uniref:hypothetical protein n=1 Tax=Ruminococcus sp. Marseille-P328 TaxID=1816688 RepID=UPI00356B036E
MKPESISEKLMFNTVRLETELGMGTGFFYNFKVNKIAARWPAKAMAQFFFTL